MTISGINLDSLTIGNYLAFDSIRLDNPQIELELPEPNEDGMRSKMTGNIFIEIVNGHINSHQGR